MWMRVFFNAGGLATALVLAFGLGAVGADHHTGAGEFPPLVIHGESYAYDKNNPTQPLAAKEANASTDQELILPDSLDDGYISHSFTNHGRYYLNRRDPHYTSDAVVDSSTEYVIIDQGPDYITRPSPSRSEYYYEDNGVRYYIEDGGNSRHNYNDRVYWDEHRQDSWPGYRRAPRQSYSYSYRPGYQRGYRDGYRAAYGNDFRYSYGYIPYIPHVIPHGYHYGYDYNYIPHYNYGYGYGGDFNRGISYYSYDNGESEYFYLEGDLIDDAVDVTGELIGTAGDILFDW